MQEMTLNQMIERLIDIRAENKRRGWADRNDLPLWVSVEQPPTPKGRLRQRKWANVKMVYSARVGGVRDHIEKDSGVIEIGCGAFKERKKYRISDWESIDLFEKIWKLERLDITQTKHKEYRLWDNVALDTVDIYHTLREAKRAGCDLLTWGKWSGYELKDKPEVN